MMDSLYLCSENKGADQLCVYCAPDLHMHKAGYFMTQLKCKLSSVTVVVVQALLSCYSSFVFPLVTVSELCIFTF